MKALVKYAAGPGHLDVLDVEEPCCGDQTVKVEVAFCGLCGTDLHVRDDTFRNFPPVILGHELAGTVVEVGGQVHEIRVGDRVTVLGATAVTCGRCAYCGSGEFIFCRQRRGMGHGVHGGFTRYVVVRPDQLYRIPDAFTLEEAALSEPFAAAIHAVTEIATLRTGDTALVSGPGPMGLLCLKLLVASGIRTVVVGASGDRRRLEAAERIGAVAVVEGGDAALSDVVKAMTGGEGVDVAFECAGHEASIRGCLDALRPMGQHVQVGICGRDVSVPFDRVFYKQLQVLGSITYTARTWDRMMTIYEQGRVRLHDLVSETLPLTEWRRAFDRCASRDGLKVLLYPVD